MEKYLIVDTFNGEGYSDSSAEVKEFASSNEAKDYALSKAIIFCGNNNSIFIDKDCVEYGVNLEDEDDPDSYQDQGAVHFVKLDSDIVSISINPSINAFYLHSYQEDRILRANLLRSEESQDGEPLEGTCHHLDDSVEIYFQIKNLI